MVESAASESDEGLGLRVQSGRIWKSSERAHERRVSGTCIMVSMNKSSLFSAGDFDDKGSLCHCHANCLRPRSDINIDNLRPLARS